MFEPQRHVEYTIPIFTNLHPNRQLNRMSVLFPFSTSRVRSWKSEKGTRTMTKGPFPYDVIFLGGWGGVSRFPSQYDRIWQGGGLKPSKSIWRHMGTAPYVAMKFYVHNCFYVHKKNMYITIFAYIKKYVHIF